MLKYKLLFFILSYFVNSIEGDQKNINYIEYTNIIEQEKHKIFAYGMLSLGLSKTGIFFFKNFKPSKKIKTDIINSIVPLTTMFLYSLLLKKQDNNLRNLLHEENGLKKIFTSMNNNCLFCRNKFKVISAYFDELNINHQLIQNFINEEYLVPKKDKIKCLQYMSKKTLRDCIKNKISDKNKIIRETKKIIYVGKNEWIQTRVLSEKEIQSEIIQLMKKKKIIPQEQNSVTIEKKFLTSFKEIKNDTNLNFVFGFFFTKKKQEDIIKKEIKEKNLDIDDIFENSINNFEKDTEYALFMVPIEKNKDKSQVENNTEIISFSKKFDEMYIDELNTQGRGFTSFVETTIQI